MSWSRWALPWGNDGKLMPVGLYASDVQLGGGQRDCFRSLDANLSDQNQVVMAVEDRNKLACLSRRAGFLYVLTYRAADVAQRKFEGTPQWILQAG